MKTINIIALAVISALTLNSTAYGKENLVGCFNTGSEHTGMKISKSLTGKYTLHLKESAESEWQEKCELRHATQEEIRALFGDSVTRIEEALVLQFDLIPNIGVFYVKKGQFGLDLLTQPAYLLYTRGGQLSMIQKVDCN